MAISMKEWSREKNMNRYFIKKAFTLVELLVVIAIIGVLVALLLPAVQAAREAARKSSCKNNLKQIGLALGLYHDAKTHLPRATVRQFANPSTVLLRILPYLEQSNLHETYDFNETLFDVSNLPVREFSVPIYLCPSMVYEAVIEPDGTSPAAGSYNACTGSKSPWVYIDSSELPPNPIPDDFDYDSISSAAGAHNGAIVSWPGLVKYKDVTDGLSNTFAIGESDYFGGTSGAGPLWAGGYVSIILSSTWGPFNPETPAPEDQPGLAGRYSTSFRSDHPGGVNFLYVDGSVHFISEDVYSEDDTNDVSDHVEDGILDALATRAGEEVLDYQK